MSQQIFRHLRDKIFTHVYGTTSNHGNAVSMWLWRISIFFSWPIVRFFGAMSWSSSAKLLETFSTIRSKPNYNCNLYLTYWIWQQQWQWSRHGNWAENVFKVAYAQLKPRWLTHYITTQKYHNVVSNSR